MLKNVLVGHCEHKVKVTNMKPHGYGVRVYCNGELNQEAIAPTRREVGDTIRSLLRMEDKCANWSDMASRSRMRPGEKINKRNADALRQKG